MNSSRPLSTKSLALQERFVVEVAGEVAHRPFEVVAFLDDVPGKVFFAVPLSAVGFREVVEIVVELHVVVDGFLAVLVAHIRVIEDVVEVVLRHESLVVSLAWGTPRSLGTLVPGHPHRRGLRCRS